MKILIIGGIAAGMSVAAKAKRENPRAEITVVEKENYISFGACGLPYYLGEQFEDANIMFARTPKQMEKLGIEILLQHEATEIDFDAKKVTVKDLANSDEKRTLEYDRLMIATGASPNLPPMEGLDSKNLYLHTKLRDADALKSALDQYHHITVIGGGFIGVEVAEQLAHLGKKVEILQGAPAIMNGPFDPEFSTLLQHALEEKGIKIHLDTFAKSLKIDGEGENGVITGVELENEIIQTDAVVLAIGFHPNTKFITDERLNTLKNGAIVINEFGETSIKDVFAAGDCATVPHRFLGDSYIPLATYANKLGRVIGTNIVSKKEDYVAFPGALGSSMIKAGDYEAGSTGLTEAQAKSAGFDYKTTLIETATHTGYYPGAEKLTIKLLYDAKEKTLLGAQIFGKKDAALRLHALSVAIHAGIKTDELGLLDLGYAPPFTTTWEAINIAANTAK